MSTAMTTAPMPDRELLASIAAAVFESPDLADVELVRILIRREHGAYVVDATIDCEGGVGTALCESIGRRIGRRIDDARPDLEYRIEVASAGLDRPLLTPEHFRRFAGKQARIITMLRIGNRTEFQGSIGSTTDDAVEIHDPHAGDVLVPYAAIKRANLVYEPSEDLKRSHRHK